MYPMSRACGVATDRLKRRNERSWGDEGKRGINGQRTLCGTCHFEARPWGEESRIAGQKFSSKPR